MIYNIATVPRNISFSLTEENIHVLDENDDIAIRIRKLRKIKKITSKQLGELIGLTPAGILQYENRKAYPSRNVLLKLKEILGTNVLCDDYSKFITSNYKATLKDYRKKNNLAYKDLAKKINMKERTYYSLENMIYIITKNNFEKYKDKLLKIIKEPI